MQADWYFDFISPFSYLQLTRFNQLPKSLNVNYKPVLFAGLLSHWENVGPAEIPAKRVQTYRQCQWRAERDEIAFKMPPKHPFNPLPALRLATGLGASESTVKSIFEFIWVEGRDLSEPAAWSELCQRLEVDDAQSLISDPEVKAALRKNTESAAALGVYGVPSFVINREIFWGDDLTQMFLAYVKDQSLFEHGEMARVSQLPIGVTRKP